MLPLFLIRLSKSEKEVLFYMTITSKEVHIFVFFTRK